GFYDVFAAFRVRRLLKQIKPDIIVAHNARAITLLSFAAQGLGVPVVGVSHSYKTARAMRADVLVVLSEHMKKHFLAAGYKGRIEVIPNLIRLPQKPVARPRRRPPVIGAIGRLSPEKGFDVLLKALGEIRQRGIAFKAVAAGDGEESAKLKSLAGELGIGANVEWPGWIEDKTRFYNRIDILCIPSRQDSFPMVVLEALAHGVPIVATNAPGPAAMLTHGVDGIIVPRDDAPALAEALATLVTQPALAAQLAENGWQTVQRYDFAATARKWGGVLIALKK
ncbi:MAG: glycosyltransferase, partial [Pseudomonadota bacterium]|nr:glycosyltransferase [Pseudomonadota bacterium]